MTEHPILFNTKMVRAILDGRKTQTRRVAKIDERDYDTWGKEAMDAVIRHHCPYGQVGDRLYVKEPFKINRRGRDWNCVIGEYTRDGIQFTKHLQIPETDKFLKWKEPYKGKSSLFMFKSLARIHLEITAIRVERVQDITYLDAKAEGIKYDRGNEDPRWVFERLWDSINKNRGYGWNVNPWVWVVEFKKIERK